MKHQELIERYIYAATRYMRKEEKEDVSKELHTIIEDMLEERCGGEEPTEEIVKEVLDELGNPREMYEKYSADGKDCLIGAPYYGVYKYVLKSILLCTAVAHFVAQMIVAVLEMPEFATVTEVIGYITAMIGEACGNIPEGLALVFTAITVGFSVMYHKGIKMDTLFASTEQLPKAPKKDAEISRNGVVVEMGFTVLFYVIFLACPEVLCMIETETGVVTPLLDTEYIRSTWYLIVAFGMLGIGRECVKLVEGTYTKNLVVVTTGVNIVSAILAGVWLMNPQIINPAFSEVMDVLFKDSAAIVETCMTNFNYFFLGCILFALIVDWGVVLWKHHKCEA